MKQVKETTKAEKTRKFLEKKRAKLAQLRGIKKEDIIIPDLEVIIDAPEPIPMNRTEMNIDRNIATAKKAQRDWDKEKVRFFFVCSVVFNFCFNYLIHAKYSYFSSSQMFQKIGRKLYSGKVLF